MTHPRHSSSVIDLFAGPGGEKGRKIKPYPVREGAAFNREGSQ